MTTWDEMSPAERDALVGTKVMGWDLRDEFFSDGDYAGALFYDEGECRGSPGEGYTPTTDIAQAWEVVEKMREEGWLVRVQEKPDDIGWDEGNAMARAYCSLSWMHRETTEGARKAIHEHPRGIADTAPEAICLAALRAKGVEV